MRLYRFSPIRNRGQLIEAVKYIARENTKLCKKITGRILPISSVTVFAHYTDEYQTLAAILHKLGKLHSENNGPRVTLRKPIKAAGHVITHLRIRKPDPYRMQVGCGDFETGDYRLFKNRYLTKKQKNLRVIQRSQYEMIEFFDPDFDVLGYVLSSSSIYTPPILSRRKSGDM